MPRTSPPDAAAFYEQVWMLARQVPRGKVATYGQIASMIPAPVGVDLKDYAALGSRWVGSAMAACPGEVPWQRVINSQGKVSRRLGAKRHRELLEAEGILFASDRVDLEIYQWQTAGPADKPAQGSLF
jgi:methylated-DNA-protein-cysteine methyltransferase related protein